MKANDYCNFYILGRAAGSIGGHCFVVGCYSDILSMEEAEKTVFSINQAIFVSLVSVWNKFTAMANIFCGINRWNFVRNDSYIHSRSLLEFFKIQPKVKGNGLKKFLNI
jgi:hypothetical protein